MTKNVLIINGNPKADSFCRALAMQYLAGAQAEGHAVRLRHIADYDQQRQHDSAGAVAASQADVAWAEHLVLVYPNWWGTLPAALKGWLDEVLAAGFAFRFDPEKQRLDALLKGKSARLVVTMDTPRWVYRLLFANGGITIMRRAVLGFCGIGPVRVSTFGQIFNSDAGAREQWLLKVRALGAQAN